MEVVCIIEPFTDIRICLIGNLQTICKYGAIVVSPTSKGFHSSSFKVDLYKIENISLSQAAS
jgi:hypothetical protein